MGDDYPDILTVKELALYLKMKPVTIYKLSKQGKIPAFRVASSWRFKKELIDKWLTEESKKNFSSDKKG